MSPAPRPGFAVLDADDLVGTTSDLLEEAVLLHTSLGNPCEFSTDVVGAADHVFPVGGSILDFEVSVVGLPSGAEGYLPGQYLGRLMDAIEVASGFELEMALAFFKRGSAQTAPSVGRQR